MPKLNLKILNIRKSFITIDFIKELCKDELVQNLEELDISYNALNLEEIFMNLQLLEKLQSLWILGNGELSFNQIPVSYYPCLMKLKKLY